jgi:transposase
VLYKRLEKGTFAWPIVRGEEPVELRTADLMLLLAGVDVSTTRRRRWYEKKTA